MRDAPRRVDQSHQNRLGARNFADHGSDALVGNQLPQEGRAAPVTAPHTVIKIHCFDKGTRIALQEAYQSESLRILPFSNIATLHSANEDQCRTAYCNCHQPGFHEPLDPPRVGRGRCQGVGQRMVKPDAGNGKTVRVPVSQHSDNSQTFGSSFVSFLGVRQNWFFGWPGKPADWHRLLLVHPPVNAGDRLGHFLTEPPNPGLLIAHKTSGGEFPPPAYHSVRRRRGIADATARRIPGRFRN